VVEKGARLVNCTLMEGTHVKTGAVVKDSIIGWRCRIGKYARVTDLCIIGEDCDIKDEVAIVGVTCCPHKSIAENIYAPKIVL
jgi:NDP-sugar pyrophosphorylase family protein